MPILAQDDASGLELLFILCASIGGRLPAVASSSKLGLLFARALFLLRASKSSTSFQTGSFRRGWLATGEGAPPFVGELCWIVAAGIAVAWWRAFLRRPPHEDPGIVLERNDFLMDRGPMIVAPILSFAVRRLRHSHVRPTVAAD